MKIELKTGTELLLSELDKDGLEVFSDDPQLNFSAMPMFVTSLALCTYTTLASYAERIKAGTGQMNIHMQWQYAERPHRIGKIDMAIRWPEVPESRLDAAMRAAAQCTLHKTLEHEPEIDTFISRQD